MNGKVIFLFLCAAAGHCVVKLIVNYLFLSGYILVGDRGQPDGVLAIIFVLLLLALF